MKKYPIMAVAALTFAACSNNENELTGTDGQPVPVEFTASVGVTETRAVDQTWSPADAIGIFMVKAGQTFLPEQISEGAENIRYVVDAGKTNGFKADGSTIYYPMDDSEVDFYAYYPQGSVTKEETTAHYLYAVNVATQTDQEALDLMYSDNVKGKKKTDKAAALTFKHQLCKIVLTVEPGEGVSDSDLDGLTVKVNGQKTTATFDLTSGVLKDDAAAADITLYKQADAYVYEAILLPAAASRTFEFDLNNGHDAPFIWDMNKELAGGSKYTYTVRLNRTGVEVTGQIEAWNPEGGNTVDAN
ncbi:fimbrillin family protein [Bacteroides fluxus]|uniref:fimbrillin family protein n=1 Tax=Bacteroides fluxus TaxID=626930 RepID=UPI0023F0027B|nr:fimbrillin family protein [Bacteroides fluxus]